VPEILIFKAPCPVCRKQIFHVKVPEQKVEFFEIAETYSLLIMSSVVIDGKIHLSLKPCEPEEPFYKQGHFPMTPRVHVKHGCTPPAQVIPQANQTEISSGSSFTNSGQILQTPGFPEAAPAVPPQVPATIPIKQKTDDF
jgi:hypothetical protein